MRLLHTVYPSSHPDEPLSAITRQPYRQPQQRGGDFRARVTVAKDGKRETVDYPLMAVENALPNWAFEKESRLTSLMVEGNFLTQASVHAFDRSSAASQPQARR